MHYNKLKLLEYAMKEEISMKYVASEMNIISMEQDILTISPVGPNEDPGWGNLDFGGAKNSPLADLANTIADKF